MHFPNVLWLVILLFILSLWIRPHRPLIDFFQPSTFDVWERKRLGFYLDNLTKNPPTNPTNPYAIHITSDDAKELISFDPSNKMYFKQNQALVQKGNEETLFDLEQLTQKYFFDPKRLFKLSTFADSIQWYSIPTLVKARYSGAKTIDQPYAILMRFRSRVHFGGIDQVKKYDIPFKDKKSAVIWRGGPSGFGFQNGFEPHIVKASREDLLRLWCTNAKTQADIDVGLIAKWNYKKYTHYLKPEMSIRDMLQYKYLLSVEGNDVATNLKWAMSSNSLVIMPRPRVESWFCETLLKPYVHYVPVKDDFSDLLTIKKWCDQHPQKCEQIVQNAKAYVKAFTNEERELFIASHVLQTYSSLVEIKLSQNSSK